MTESNLSGADLLDRIQHKINNADTTIATYLLEWLNDRYYRVLNLPYKLPFLQTEDSTTLHFSDSSDTHALPADYKSFISFWDATNNKNLQVEELNKIRLNNPNISNKADSPDYVYFVAGEVPSATIGIWPKLNTGKTCTISMLYQKELTALTDSGTSIPVIPNRHRASILVNGTIAEYYFNWMRDSEKGSIFEALSQKAVQDMLVAEGIIGTKSTEELSWHWNNQLKDVTNVNPY